MVWMWLGFTLLVMGMLALDLGVFHRTHHVVGTKEALAWTAVWIGMAVAFSVFIYFAYENHWAGLGNRVDDAVGTTTDGKSAALKYLSGYVLEKSLSVDNIFVISVIFGSFAVPLENQHRVLFWGVIGAILMRAVMIIVGTELIARHHWVVYVFGLLLIVTAIKMLVMKANHSRLADNMIVRLARRLLPVTDRFHGTRFIVFADSTAGSAFALTPLALALIAVEATDLLFAVDSVPAIFAVTADPFLVFTGNVFAMLGLRSLYFALAGMIERFRYLKASLAVVLAVVGIKMLAAGWLKARFGSGFEIWLLAIILLILAIGILASWIADRRGAGDRDKTERALGPNPSGDA
jgi:tellurite resistance protein TerC